MKNLITPAKFGKLNLKNRVLLAPMTRMRAEKDGTPNDLIAEFYSQRSSYGLVITECSPINSTCNTYPGKIISKVHRFIPK